MSQDKLRISLVFNPDDQAWIRRMSIAVPKFWDEPVIAPERGDVVRFGGRQFIIEARIWEHDGLGPVLRLFVGSAHAESDTSFG